MQQNYSSRQSRQNLQHFDYNRKRHSENNKMAGQIVFGIATVAGVASAVIMAKCEEAKEK